MCIIVRCIVVRWQIVHSARRWLGMEPAPKKLTIREQLGREVKRRRNALNLSQEEFADLADLDRSYVPRLEAGKVRPRLDTIEKIAKGLNTSVGQLMRNLR